MYTPPIKLKNTRTNTNVVPAGKVSFRYVLFVVSIISLITIIAGVAHVRSISINTRRQEMKENVELAWLHFQFNQENEAARMSQSIATIMRNKDIEKALIAQDRDRLLELTSDMFARFIREFKTTHFYFMRPDKSVLLRVHNPGRHGDVINRMTMTRAAETGRSAHGAELGPLQTFTLRVVFPWYVDGDLIGYVELGEEIHNLGTEMARMLDLDFIFVIDKTHIDRIKWEKGQRVMGRNGRWDQYPSFVETDRTIDKYSSKMESGVQRIVDVANEPYATVFVKDDNKYLALSAFPQKSMDGKRLGSVIVIKDQTPYVLKSRFNVFLALLCVVIFIVILVVTVNKTWQTLNDSRSELQEVHDKLENTNRRLTGDLEKRKRMELELIKREEQFRAIAWTASNGIVVTDESGKVSLWNPAAERIFGYSDDEIIGSELHDVIAMPECARKSRDKIKTFCDTGSGASTGKHAEVTAIHKSGKEIPIEISLSAIRAGRGWGSVAIVQDVTKRKEEEREKASLISALESKNSELESFTHTVSHDLKSPLVTIKGFIGALEDDLLVGNADDVKADVARISGAADKMYSLIEDLLSLSRVGRVVGKSEELHLGNLAREAADLVAGQIKESGASLIVSDAMPTVRGDKIRLREVFQNLIDNAIKYADSQTPPVIEIGVLERNEELIIYVKDNGMGIDPKYLKDVFGLFKKLTRDGRGTGIGLAIVKRIIEVHGGRVWVESEGTGKGSTFLFTIPAGSP